ncbi:hypothetical protein [Herpetosiphon llansteffanensis]|uniref:hypothetical protein n=1 Tax=Herpetosiphon llansteffanensis TaxID=2094568 RepID=UPI000D7CD712|nr:hypothetical protein [Herpetosiphon llansteffanensis]
MQSAPFKQRLRVPHYGTQVVLGVIFLIMLILMGATATWIKHDWVSRWNFIILPIGFIQFAINAISYLDISARGLVMRRGWQYFEINWEQIESFGIGVIGKRIHLPYIVLYQPIKGLPNVTIKELTPEQQQRTLTLEGWANSEIIAKALHARLNATNQQLQVIPDFSKSHQVFYSYQNLYICLSIIGVSIFIYFILK